MSCGGGYGCFVILFEKGTVMNTLHAQDKRLARFMPAVAAVVAWLSLSPAAALACGLTVTEDTTLKADLLGCDGDGIVVASDGVTIDLDGHSIVGVRNERTAGIRVHGVSGVTIKNGTVAAFERGIYLYDAENVTVSKVEVNASRYEGLLAYQSSAVHVNDSVFTNNFRSAVWIYDSDAELLGNLGLDNPNRTFYLSGGRVTMTDNEARGGAYYSAFTFADGYTGSTYTLSDNLAENSIGVGYLFAWGFAGSVTDGGGNRAVDTGGVDCWTQEGVSCPLDLSADSTWPLCGDGICEVEESACSCASDCGLPPVEICDDGIENDCDDDTDCDDADCGTHDICYIAPVPVPVECELPGAACVTDDDCCSGGCRTSASGRTAGTCR